jgi:hypothetical protein
MMGDSWSELTVMQRGNALKSFPVCPSTTTASWCDTASSLTVTVPTHDLLACTRGQASASRYSVWEWQGGGEGGRSEERLISYMCTGNPSTLIANLLATSLQSRVTGHFKYSFVFSLKQHPFRGPRGNQKELVGDRKHSMCVLGMLYVESGKCRLEVIILQAGGGLWAVLWRRTEGTVRINRWTWGKYRAYQQLTIMRSSGIHWKCKLPGPIQEWDEKACGVPRSQKVC